MGTLTSALAPILQVGANVARFAQPAINTRYNEQQSDLSYQYAKQNAALQKKQNLLDLQNAETERQSKLKKLISAQRAQFGGHGVRSGAGSSEAVLQGFFEDSDIKRQQNEYEASLVNDKINLSLSEARQRNLLEREQGRQKTALNYYTKYF